MRLANGNNSDHYVPDYIRHCMFRLYHLRSSANLRLIAFHSLSRLNPAFIRIRYTC